MQEGEPVIRLLPVLLLALYGADAAATLTNSARQMGVERSAP